MPPIGALGFNPDGSQLWTATHGSIEIRSWPDLSLLRAAPWSQAVVRVHYDGLPTGNRQALAFHPAGRMVALAYRSTVFLLDREAQPLNRDRTISSGVYGIAFAEDGRVLVANTGGVLAVGPSGDPEPLGVPPNGPIPVDTWRAAIAPWAKTAIYCVNDQAALFYSWETGLVRRADEWSPAFRDQDESSWLAADLAPGGRALVCGTKSGETWIVETGPRFEPVRIRDVAKANLRRPDKMKLPMRTSTHAIHPTDDALVFAEISGFVFHAKLSTGEIVRELPRAGAGYAWE